MKKQQPNMPEMRFRIAGSGQRFEPKPEEIPDEATFKKGYEEWLASVNPYTLVYINQLPPEEAREEICKRILRHIAEQKSNQQTDTTTAPQGATIDDVGV